MCHQMSQLSRWDEIFRNWISCLERALELSGRIDSPYLHREHGNNHALALAAELSDYCVIPELVGDNEKRLDMCIFNKTEAEMIEAKWYEYDGSRNLSRVQVENRVSHAILQLQQFSCRHGLLRKYKTHKRVVIYVTPHFLEEPSERELKRCAEKILEVGKSLGLHESSCYFPRNSLGLKYYSDRYYPGVVALMKLAES